MASDLTTYFNPNIPRKVQFHVAPVLSNENIPLDHCRIVDHDASGVLLEWRDGGYAPERVFVPWANIIAIYPI